MGEDSSGIHRQRAVAKNGCHLPRNTTWAKLPSVTKIVTLNVVGFTLATTCLIIEFAAVYHLAFRRPSESVAQIVVVAAAGTVVGCGLMIDCRHRSRCTHCNSALWKWSDAPPLIWCSVCRSIFDPSKEGLPMKGNTLFLRYYLDHPDTIVQALGEVLDEAVTNRTDELVFLTSEEDASDDLLIPECSTPRSIEVIPNAACYVEILAEFDRRVRSASGESANEASTFELFGTQHQASVTLELDQTVGGRRATLTLDYAARNH